MLHLLKSNEVLYTNQASWHFTQCNCSLSHLQLISLQKESENFTTCINSCKVKSRHSVQTGGSVDLAWSHHEKSHLHNPRNCKETPAANPDHIQCSARPASYVWK